MQKKYQVFISSTYTDLVEERKKVQEVLLMADCIPAGMEAFSASNEEQFNVIKKVIDLCDYYILIIGKRYGSINASTGLSYTEMEYDYAVSIGLPILVFSIDDNVKLSKTKMESDEEKIKKLVAFKEKAMGNRLASIWKNADDLGGRIALAIMKAKIENSRPGWLRGDVIDLEKNAEKLKVLENSNKELLEKNKKLQEELDDILQPTEGLLFDEEKIRIYYKQYSTSDYYVYKDVTIKEIFAYVSASLIKVSLRSDGIEELIAQSIGADSVSRLKEKNIVKKICNQFVALKLMTVRFVDGKGQFFSLTPKGEKIRDEFNLFKRENK